MNQNPDVIFTLTAINDYTRNIFSHRSNERYYICPPQLTAATTRESSVATNIGDGDYERDGGRQDFRHHLRFTFDKKPKNIQDGWVFGSDAKTCDVFIGKPIGGLSRSHFRITFDKEGRLVVIDSSTHGTAVSYDAQARDEKRKNPSHRNQRKPRDKSNDFAWILFPKIEDKRVIVGEEIKELPEAPVLEFSVEDVVNPDSDLANAYLAEMRAAIPFGLNIDSHPTTAGQTESDTPIQRPKQDPIWINRDVIGEGQSGKVHQALDVSTGAIYAAKELKLTDKASLESFERECELLSKISHDHIVKFVGYETRGEHPRLIMEYLPKNLRQSNLTSAITPWETVTLLCQGLDALDFLHSRNIVHRDLKPENILVQFREPNFRIKITDFGLARDATFLKTCCGTAIYLAPEISQFRRYTNKVDIWSLGLVAFEYAFKLPYRNWRDPQCDWYDQIMERINVSEPGGLLDFLNSSMLLMDPDMRLTAGECLSQAKKLLETVAPTQNLEVDPGTPTDVMASGSILRRIEPYMHKLMAAGMAGAHLEVDFGMSPNTISTDSLARAIHDQWESQVVAGERAGTLSDFSTNTQIWNPPPDTKHLPWEVEESQDRVKSSVEEVCRESASKLQRIRQPSNDLSPTEQAPWQRHEDQALIEHPSPGRANYSPESKYLQVKAGLTTVSIRRADFWINATHIVKAHGSNNYKTEIIKVRNRYTNHNIVRGGAPAHQGTYLDPLTGLELCQEQGPKKLARDLRRSMEDHGWEPSQRVNILAPEGDATAVDAFEAESADSFSVEWPMSRHDSPSTPLGHTDPDLRNAGAAKLDRVSYYTEVSNESFLPVSKNRSILQPVPLNSSRR